MTKGSEFKKTKVVFLILHKLPGPMGRNRLVSFLILSLFILSIFSYLSFPSEKIHLSSANSIRRDKYNLLLITIDTLRADRLSCYSTRHLRTPNIDMLAERGTLFLRAFAHTPTTLPSHANIFLGTTPLYHGVHENTSFIVMNEFLTLAELLKQHGYSTAAFVGAVPLDSRFGLDQGFDIYDDDYDSSYPGKYSSRERRANEVIERAIEWLKIQESQWFLFIHCFDPHSPYEPPDPFRKQYENNLYDGEVAYVDYIMSKLILFLEENDLFTNTLIVLTGDHGESLGEHGEETHGIFAYNSTIWVPLIISVPGLEPKRVTENVSHIDIFPTVCDVLGIEKPSFLQGVSLLPSLKGKKLIKRSIYFESLISYYKRGWAPIMGYIFEREKFIDSPLPELYDLKDDFDEFKNLSELKNLDRYKKELNRIIKSQSLDERVKAEQRVDWETLEKLKTLGYISSPHASIKEKYGPEDDVKVLFLYHNKSEKALRLCKEDKVQEGIDLLKEVITERKNVPVAYTNLAFVYRRLGRLNDALEVLKLGLESLPSNYDIFSDYVNDLFETGQYDTLIKLFEETNLRQMDYDPMLWIPLGNSYMIKGDFQNTLRAYDKSISIDKKFPLPYHNLGLLYYSIFQETKEPSAYRSALENYKKAIELNPYYGAAYNGLGITYLEAGDYDLAISSLEKALRSTPDIHQALFYLGIAHMNKGNNFQAYIYFNNFKVSPSYNLLSPQEKEKLEKYILMCKSVPVKR